MRSKTPASNADIVGTEWKNGVQERRISGGRLRQGSVSAAGSCPPGAQYDLVCLSHLRWDFVHQRPQHLLSRCAKARRVFFVEEPMFDDGPARLHVSFRADKLAVV